MVVQRPLRGQDGAKQSPLALTELDKSSLGNNGLIKMELRNGGRIGNMGTDNLLDSFVGKRSKEMGQ